MPLSHRLSEENFPRPFVIGVVENFDLKSAKIGEKCKSLEKLDSQSVEMR